MVRRVKKVACGSGKMSGGVKKVACGMKKVACGVYREKFVGNTLAEVYFGV